MATNHSAGGSNPSLPKVNKIVIKRKGNNPFKIKILSINIFFIKEVIDAHNM